MFPIRTRAQARTRSGTHARAHLTRRRDPKNSGAGGAGGAPPLQAHTKQGFCLPRTPPQQRGRVGQSGAPLRSKGRNTVPKCRAFTFARVFFRCTSSEKAKSHAFCLTERAHTINFTRRNRTSRNQFAPISKPHPQIRSRRSAAQQHARARHRTKVSLSRVQLPR